MITLKVGDIVRLINTDNLQQECRVYAVGELALITAAWSSSDGTPMVRISISGVEIKERAFYAKRFELIEAVEYPISKKILESVRPSRTLTLPTDSADRKNYPLAKGCLEYFPAALAGVANISKVGNDKHNPGEPLHHARGKSMDHRDCIVRHLMDAADLLAAIERGANINPQGALNELNQLAWRALALSQETHEKFGAPLAPGAKK